MSDLKKGEECKPLSQSYHIGCEISDKIVYNDSHDTIKVFIANLF